MKLLQYGLIALLLGTAAAKLISGHQDGFSLSPTLYHGAAIVELVIVALFILGRTKPASFAAVAFGLAGLLRAIIVAGDASCGCMGSLVRIQRFEQMLLSGTVSAIGSLILLNLISRDGGSKARVE